MNSTDDSIVRDCVSCGAAFHGKYCNQCREKILDNKERTVRYFIIKVFNASTLVDNKIFKALWMMARHPGQLSKEYVMGRRKLYFNPVSLFFALNLIYFLFPLFETFNTSYRSQIQHQQYSSIAKTLVDKKINQYRLDPKKYEETYNSRSNSLAKILLVCFVFLISLPLYLIFFSKARYYADYLTYSFEFTSFNLFFNTIFLSVLINLIGSISHTFQLGLSEYLENGTISIIALITNLYFLYSGGRLFFGLSYIRSLIYSLLMMPGLLFSLLSFRFILFIFTYLLT